MVERRRQRGGHEQVPSVAVGECWVGLGCDEEGTSFRPTIHGKFPEPGLSASPPVCKQWYLSAFSSQATSRKVPGLLFQQHAECRRQCDAIELVGIYSKGLTCLPHQPLPLDPLLLLPLSLHLPVLLFRLGHLDHHRHRRGIDLAESLASKALANSSQTPPQTHTGRTYLAKHPLWQLPIPPVLQPDNLPSISLRIRHTLLLLDAQIAPRPIAHPDLDDARDLRRLLDCLQRISRAHLNLDGILVRHDAVFKKFDGAEQRRETVPLRGKPAVPGGDGQRVGKCCRGGPEREMLQGRVALEELRGCQCWS